MCSLVGQFHEERYKVKKIEIFVFSQEIDCLNTKLSYMCSKNTFYTY